MNGWRKTGICPWDPNELLLNQGLVLFRAPVEEQQVAQRSQDDASKAVLTLPNSMMEVKVNCTHCSKPILVCFKSCSVCSQANENHDAAAATVMNQGRRRGAKRVRPTNFDVEQLVRGHFEGLRAVADAGQEALLGTGNSDSSSDSSNKQGDDDEPPPPLPPPPSPPPPLPAPKYDPPTVVPAQLRTKAGARKAWTNARADVEDFHYLPTTSEY